MIVLNKSNILKGLATACILVIILIPDVLLELTEEMFHALFELIAEGAHLVFESLEISLDTVIELLFETEVHNTQIIVFYIIIGAFCYGLYRLCRLIPNAFAHLRATLRAHYLYHKARLYLYWRDLPMPEKLKLVGMVVGGGLVMVLISF